MSGQFQQSMVASGQAALPANVKPAAKAPVQYEEACKALELCQTIDEGKYFANQSDALAAWAKIYNDDRAAAAARMLKIRAYQRVGILAQQLRPGGNRTERGQMEKGPQSLLMESGFKPNQAVAALAVARMPVKDFERAISQPKPPSPATIAQVGGRKNPAAAKLAIRFTGLLSILRQADFESLVASMDDRDLSGAQSRNREAMRLIGQLQSHIDLRRKAKP